MEWILGGLAAVCAIVSAILLRAYASVRADAGRLSTLDFVAGKSTLPDSVIADDPPLRVAVGAKYLYVSTFDVLRYGKFMQAFSQYLTAIKRIGVSIEFLAIVDGQLEKVASDTVLATNAEAEKVSREFIADWLLSDKRSNPHKVTRKYLARNASPSMILSLLYALKWYNMDTVKKKAAQIEAILTGNATLATLSSGPAAPTDGQSSAPCIPNFPSYSSWLAEDGKVVSYPSAN